MNTTDSPIMVLRPMTKKELYDKFKIYGWRKVRAEMNEVISTLRGVPMKEAKVQKVLHPGEVRELEKRFS